MATEAPQPTTQQLGQTEPQSPSFLAFIEAEAGGGRPTSRKGRGPRRLGSKSSTTTTAPVTADLEPAAAADASGEEKREKRWDVTPDQSEGEEKHDGRSDVTPDRSEGEEVETKAEAEATVADEAQVAAPLGFTLCWESPVVSTFETTDTSSPFFRPSFTFTPAAASEPASADVATPTTTEATPLFSPSPSASPSPTGSPFGSPFSSPASASPFTGFSPFSASSTSSLTPSLTPTTTGTSPVAKVRAVGKRSAAARKAKPASLEGFQ